jgi:DNA polymerase III epsilon subunit family exonuclease
MSWHERSWSVFDTETTGFRSNARVVELGVVIFEMGRPVRRWSSLLCPPDLEWDSPDVLAAFKVNGLSREKLQGAPRFEDVVHQLLVEFDSDVWVAHNYSFDQRMLSQEFTRCKVSTRAPAFRICTLDLARKFVNYSPGNKLEEVASRFGVTLSGAHRAVADAEACGQVLTAMVRGGYVPTDDMAMQQMCKSLASSKKR